MVFGNKNINNRYKKSIKGESKDGNKYGLMIGINYINCDESMRLQGCINDILFMKDMLFKKYNYKNKNVTLLRDDSDDFRYKPTGNNILYNLRNIVLKANPNDEIWIHYSGHGSFIKDTDGDELDGNDEVLIPSDFEENGVITDDILLSILELSKCPIMITMDCCHSGSICDLTYSFHYQSDKTFSRKVERKKHIRNQNIFMLSGCRDNQTSADVGINDHYEGAFTRALIDSLEYHDFNVHLFQLYISILDCLEIRGYTQRTLLSSSNPAPFISIHT